MKQKAAFYSLICILLLLPAELWSQDGGFAGTGTSLGFSPKNMAMANAMTATTSEGIFPYYNPAFAALQQESIQIDLSVAALKYDRVYQTAGGTFKIPPNAGMALAIIRSGVNNIDGRTLSGYPSGRFNTSEYQILGAFGLNLSEKMKAGIGFKLNYSDLNEEVLPSTAVGVDLGVLYIISKHLQAGLSIQDLFAEYSWDSSTLYGFGQSQRIPDKFPTRFKAGLSWSEVHYTLSADFEVRSFESKSRTQSETQELTDLSTSGAQFRLGGSWKAHERITLRGGISFPDLSAMNIWGSGLGFSVHLPFDKYTPSVDYAFVTEPNQLSNMHVFSLSLKL